MWVSGSRSIVDGIMGWYTGSVIWLDHFVRSSLSIFLVLHRRSCYYHIRQRFTRIRVPLRDTLFFIFFICLFVMIQCSTYVSDRSTCCPLNRHTGIPPQLRTVIKTTDTMTNKGTLRSQTDSLVTDSPSVEGISVELRNSHWTTWRLGRMNNA